MPDARATLLNLFTEDVAESGFVSRDRNGKPRQPRDIARAFQRLVDKAALLETEDGKVTFHALRARSAGTEGGLSGNG